MDAERSTQWLQMAIGLVLLTLSGCGDTIPSPGSISMPEEFRRPARPVSTASDGSLTNVGRSRPASAQGFRSQIGDDFWKKVVEARKSIEESLNADRWSEAIERAENVALLREQVQGKTHYEAVTARWRVGTLRRVAAMPKPDRDAYSSLPSLFYKDYDGRRAAAPSKGDQETHGSAGTTSLYQQICSLEVQEKFGEAQPLYERILDIRRRLLTDDHPETASAYHNLAYNLYEQGRYAEAQPLFERALAIHRRLLTDDHLNTAYDYLNLASNLEGQKKLVEAQGLLEKGLAIYHRILPADHPDNATAYNNLARNLEEQRKYAEAQPFYEKALNVCSGHPPSRSTGRICSNAASNLNTQGRFAEAQILYEKALDITRRRLTDDHPETASCYHNLAGNLNAQGRFVEAQPLFEKALEIRCRLRTGTHPEITNSYLTLAANLSAQGRFLDAQPFYEKALALYRSLRPGARRDTAAGYSSLASNLRAQRKHVEAQHLYEEALAIYRRLGTDEHLDGATAYHNLASVLDDQGKYAEAQPLHQKALDIRRRLLTDNHPATALCFDSLASNVYAQGKYAEARELWVQATRSSEASRNQVAFSGLERAAVATSIRPSLTAALARFGQPLEAWECLEEDLGRGLLDELFTRREGKLSPGDRSRLHDLVTRLESLDRVDEATVERLDQAERAEQLEELRNQRVQTRIALGEFQSMFMKTYGPLVGKVAALPEIQAVLTPDTGLVAWVDVKPRGPKAADPDGEHWGVIVRSKGAPAWVRLQGTGPDGHWIEDDTSLPVRVRDALRTRQRLGATDFSALIRQLRTQRLEPLEVGLKATADGLPPVRRLIVLPSSALAGIPVEVLLPPGDPRTVSYTPSATVLSYLKKQSIPYQSTGLLVVGDPTFERPDASTDPDRIQFEPLPGTRAEADALAREFREAKRRVEVLLGDDASEPQMEQLVDSGELGKFAYIHFATHGVLDEAFPSRSAVILTQRGLPDPLYQMVYRSPVYDGRVTVREIQRRWTLNAVLVTLSACDTARGRYLGGEGFVGFTQALLMSGAQSVCLSLWKVDDAATSLLMHRFYQNLLGSRAGLTRALPKAEALAEAKAWLRELPAEEAAVLSRGEHRKLPPGQLPSTVTGFKHPYYWAGFILTGNPD